MRDLKVRYRQAALGVAWAIIQPVFAVLIFTLVFGHFAKMPSDGIPYAVFAFAAVLPWTYFAEGSAPRQHGPRRGRRADPQGLFPAPHHPARERAVAPARRFRAGFPGVSSGCCCGTASRPRGTCCCCRCSLVIAHAARARDRACGSARSTCASATSSTRCPSYSRSGCTPRPWSIRSASSRSAGKRSTASTPWWA